MNFPEHINRGGDDQIERFSGGDQPAGSMSPIRPARLALFFRQFWWLPALTLALGIAAAVAYLIWAPMVFVSEASLWEPDRLRLPDGGMFSEDAQTYFGTQIELLRTRELAGRAIKHLQESGANVLDKNGEFIQESLAISQVPKSSILELTVSSPNADFSQAFLGALLNEYLNLRKSESDDTLASISQQVTNLEHSLNVEQDALTTFEQTNNLAVLQEEGMVAAQYLETLNTQLSDDQLELKLLGTNTVDISGSLRGTGMNNGGAAFSPDTAHNSDVDQDPELRNADWEIDKLNLERQTLSQVYLPKHPKLVKLDAEIERAHELSQLFHAQSKKQLDQTRQTLQARLGDLQVTIRQWQGKIITANAKIAEADRLKLNVNRVEGVYDRYLALLKSVDINRNIVQEGFSILQSATPPLHSRKQQQLKACEMIVGGLSLGLGLVVFIAWRDHRFASMADVSETFGDKILGQVPEMALLKGEDFIPLLKLEDERAAYAESYRNLRSAILFMPNPGERAKIILVTSAMPHEGKSTIAANLARALALGGSRTLLIDADLRQGHLHQLLGLNRQRGLTDLLLCPEIGDNVMQTNCWSNLFFISRGSAFPRPGDLLVGESLGTVLANLRKQFSFIIIDSSPVFASDDATTLAPQADGTIFVVRSRVSRSDIVRRALDLLLQRQASILGVVVNGADTTDHAYYYKDSDYHHPRCEDDVSCSA